MSWDIQIIKVPAEIKTAADLISIEENPLGTLSEVIAILSTIFPDADYSNPTWIYLERNNYSIEFNMGEDNMKDNEIIDFIMLHIHGNKGVLKAIEILCASTGWCAWDLDKGDFIAFDNMPATTKQYGGIIVQNDSSVTTKKIHSIKGSKKLRSTKRQIIKEFIEAINVGNLNEVKILLKEGISPDTKDKIGYPVLFTPVVENNIEMARVLLEAGADSNALPYLWRPSYAGRIEMVSLLLSFGANPNAIDSDGESPLIMAISTGRLQVVRELINAGAIVDMKHSLDRTALMNVSSGGVLCPLGGMIPEEGLKPVETEHWPEIVTILIKAVLPSSS